MDKALVFKTKDRGSIFCWSCNSQKLSPLKKPLRVRKSQLKKLSLEHYFLYRVLNQKRGQSRSHRNSSQKFYQNGKYWLRQNPNQIFNQKISRTQCHPSFGTRQNGRYWLRQNPNQILDQKISWCQPSCWMVLWLLAQILPQPIPSKYCQYRLRKNWYQIWSINLMLPLLMFKKNKHVIFLHTSIYF